MLWNISADNQLTSWEEYNYILLGLVNELIELGAKDELKLTTLQLWATYLRVHEVAFFSQREPRIPKLNASFKSKYVLKWFNNTATF